MIVFCINKVSLFIKKSATLTLGKIFFFFFLIGKKVILLKKEWKKKVHRVHDSEQRTTLKQREIKES